MALGEHLILTYTSLLLSIINGISSYERAYWKVAYEIEGCDKKRCGKKKLSKFFENC
ncbi:MAG: hypothetical protein H0Z19_07625 [Archaeoglobus sp.]|nr:hypothetical protein [Archaeoglobus sp.]